MNYKKILGLACLATLAITLFPTELLATTKHFGTDAVDELTDKFSDIIFSKGLRFAAITGIGGGIASAVYNLAPSMMWTCFLVGGASTIALPIVDTLFVKTMLIP